MKYGWKAFTMALLFFVTAGCTNWIGFGEEPPPVAEESGYHVLAEKLFTPWSIAIAGDSVYISERIGNVVEIGEDGSFVRKPVRLQKAVHQQGESGFLGFVLAPDFSSTQQAYAYHTYEEGGQVRNRIVLLQEKGNVWEEAGVLLEGIPGEGIHDGGRLAFGPDGFLYATTGDAGEEERAQDLSSLAGKILRLAPDGSVPKDNPFPNSYVFSYGHRNSQGLAWDQGGVMYSSEHGPSGRPGGHDELNIIEAGANYGWPAIIGDEQRDGMVSPIFHTGEEAMAPSGIAVDDEGRIVAAALRGQGVYRFDPRSKRIETLLEGEGRIRDVKIHEGRMYVITNNTDGRGSPSDTDDRLLVLTR